MGMQWYFRMKSKAYGMLINKKKIKQVISSNSKKILTVIIEQVTFNLIQFLKSQLMHLNRDLITHNLIQPHIKAFSNRILSSRNSNLTIRKSVTGLN